jgi:hypothetical protein
MDKNSEIKFIGQSIMKQILGLLSVINLDSLIKKRHADYYWNCFTVKAQLAALLFGILN